jgi:hypothetical protein
MGKAAQSSPPEAKTEPSVTDPRQAIENDLVSVEKVVEGKKGDPGST